MAAQADQGPRPGQGVELGTWGILEEGVTVVTEGSSGTSTSSGVLLGSVQNARDQLGKEETDEPSVSENRILILADLQHLRTVSKRTLNGTERTGRVSRRNPSCSVPMPAHHNESYSFAWSAGTDRISRRVD